MCAVLCAVCPEPMGSWRGECRVRGRWDDTGELVRTRCGRLLSGGSQARTLPGAAGKKGTKQTSGRDVRAVIPALEGVRTHKH